MCFVYYLDWFVFSLHVVKQTRNKTTDQGARRADNARAKLFRLLVRNMTTGQKYYFWMKLFYLQHCCKVHVGTIKRKKKQIKSPEHGEQKSHFASLIYCSFSLFVQRRRAHVASPHVASPHASATHVQGC